MSIEHSYYGDPHEEWALEGVPDYGEEDDAFPMCMDCENFMPLSEVDGDYGACNRQIGEWGRSWRIKHPDGSWAKAVADTAIWLTSNGIICADDSCDDFERK